MLKRGTMMKSREELEKMTDEELDKLLPVGLDVASYEPDYTKTKEEEAKKLREEKIKIILEE